MVVFYSSKSFSSFSIFEKSRVFKNWDDVLRLLFYINFKLNLNFYKNPEFIIIFKFNFGTYNINLK